MYLLDTNICIYIIKASPESVKKRFQRCARGDVGISSISVSELMFGVARSARPEQNRKALAAFLAPLELLDYPVAAADHYGQTRAALRKRGTPVGDLDLLIASHALYLGWTLVTNNEKEFRRIPGLRVENWVH